MKAADVCPRRKPSPRLSDLDALTTTQQALAEGDARARRYPTEITPFAATADMIARNFAALGALMSPQDIAVLFTPDAVSRPPRFKVVLADTGEQMIGTPVETPANGVDIVTLGVDDVPAMIELTALTKPGPFSARTHELGTFSVSASTGSLSRWPASG